MSAPEKRGDLNTDLNTACPECGAPLDEGRSWCAACGSNLTSSRPSYVQAGAALRGAHDRAVAAGDLTGRDWRVLSAIFALVTSWSRLTDRLAASQIADAAGLDVRATKRSLARLRDRGVITRGESRGRRSADTGLPPQQWSQTTTVDPVDNPATGVADDHGPLSATGVADDHRSTANSGRNGPATVVADDHPPEKTEKKAFAREASGAAPPGSAGGQPAPHAPVHQLPPPAGDTPPGPELEPRLFDEIRSPAIRSMLERVTRAHRNATSAGAIRHEMLHPRQEVNG